MREIGFFSCSLSRKKERKVFLSVVFFCLDFASFFITHNKSHYIRRIVIVILLRGVGVVFIKKDDAAYDDVHCEDASSTPRW